MNNIPGLNVKLQDKCIALYEVLVSESKEVESTEGTHLFWTGKISDAYVKAEIPNGSTNLVSRQLVELGCIDYVQRGNSAQPTVLRLVRDPSLVEWIKPERANRNSDLTSDPAYATMRQTVEDTSRQLRGLDLKRTLAALDSRVTKLESDNLRLTKRLDGLSGESTEQAN